MGPAAHAVTLTKIADIGFGVTDYTLPVAGAVSLGTNGTIGYSGSFAGTGMGVAGQVELADSIGVILEVSCADGTLAHSGGSSMMMEATVVVGTPQTRAWGTTPACDGLGNTALTHTIDAGTAANMLYVGARLMPGGVSDGTFNTVNSGGVPIQVRVIVQ